VSGALRASEGVKGGGRVEGGLGGWGGGLFGGGGGEIKVEMADEVVMGLMRAVQDLSSSVRQISDRYFVRLLYVCLCVYVFVRTYKQMWVYVYIYICIHM